MKTFIIIAACIIANLAAAQTIRQIAQIIREESAFSFTDRSSVFTFKNSGEFSLEPTGMGGRTITGTWTNDGGGIFVITGHWGWMNGESLPNDYREMRIDVRLKSNEPISQASPGPVRRWKLYDVYFTIEDIHRIDAPSLNMRNVKAEQSVPGYPPQGVGSPEP